MFGYHNCISTHSGSKAPNIGYNSLVCAIFRPCHATIFPNRHTAKQNSTFRNNLTQRLYLYLSIVRCTIG